MRYVMDKEDIVITYKQAKNKAEQIDILADLTMSDEETIITILRDAGVNAGIKRVCGLCGREYFTKNKRGKALCLPCHEALLMEKVREQTRIRQQISRNISRINDILKENESLKRELKAWQSR